MTADPNRILVTTGATADAVQAHHHAIPELRSDGESPGIAAEKPARTSTRESDGVPVDRHREAFPYRHVHNPVFGADRPSCPVCGKATYSHGGFTPSALRSGRQKFPTLR